MIYVLFVKIYIVIISVDELIEEYLDYLEEWRVILLDIWGYLFGCVIVIVNV